MSATPAPLFPRPGVPQLAAEGKRCRLVALPARTQTHVHRRTNCRTRRRTGPGIACRPWDRADFHRRLASFTPSQWFACSGTLSPVDCARRGWVCVGRVSPTSGARRLRCESCAAVIDVMALGHKGNGSKSADKYRRALLEQHVETCPWKRLECPATIYDLPAAGSSKLLRDFFVAEVQAMKAALAAVASAPSIRIARDLFEDVRPRLAAALGVAISQDDSPSAAATCDTAIEPQEQRDLCAGWLVLSGWTRLAADEQDEYDVAPLLGCRMCHRVLGAWCFRENGIDPFQQHRPFCAFMRKEKKRSNTRRVETEYVDTQQQRHDATPRFIWAELLLAAAGSKHDAALERMRDLLQRPFMASAEE